MASDLIHVLGGGPWQLPTVLRCRELGYRVLVTDPCPDRPAFAHADLHEAVDITDAPATLAVSRRHGVDGIVCDTTDWGVATAAFVADALGLPGISLDAALNVTDKSRMRRLTKAAGIPSPRFAVVGRLDALPEAAAEVGLPLVIKPVDNQSGHGVSIVTDWSTLESAGLAAMQRSRRGQVLLEQALPGVEIIVDGFVTHGRCEVLGIAQKIPYPDNPTVCSRILYGAAHELPAPDATIRDACQHVVAVLGLLQGVVHAEFIVDGNSITPIDVAARGGGVQIYRRVIPHVSGVDVNRAVIEQCVGLSPKARPLDQRRCACIEFFRLPPGRLDAWHGVDRARAVPGVATVTLNVAPGDLVGALADKDRRPGYVIALGDSTAEVLASVTEAKARIAATMNGEPASARVL